MNYYMYFGNDIAADPSAKLKGVVERGYRLFPFDPHGMGLTLAAGFEPLTPGHFFSTTRLKQIRMEVERTAMNWFETERQAFTSSGICWPHTDYIALYWSWYDAVLIRQLARMARKRGSRVLMDKLPSRLKPSVFVYTSGTATPYHIPKVLLKEFLGDLAVQMESTGGLPPAVRSPLVEDSGEASAVESEPEALRDAVFFVTTASEYFRFRHIIADLADRFRGSFVLGSTHVPNPRVREYSREYSLPVVGLPEKLAEDNGPPERFLQAYRRLTGGDRRKVWSDILAALPFHFQYYCRERWPRLDRVYNYWLELFRKKPPKAVIVSNIDVLESQLPARAASQLGIPSFAIPHGAVGRNRIQFQQAGHLLCNSEFHRILYEQSASLTGTVDKKLLKVNGLILEDEIRFEKGVELNCIPGSTTILVLLSLSGFNGLIYPLVHRRAQVRGIDIIGDIPHSLAGKVDIRVKVHPNGRDVELLKCLQEEKWLVPLKAKLSEVLDQASLVVSLNNYASSVVHAVRERKPIIFLKTDRVLDLQWPMQPQTQLLARAGVTYTNKTDFWKGVRRFLKDRDFARQLKELSADFADKYWQDTGYKDISQVLRENI